MPPVFIYNMPAVNPNNPSQGGSQRTSFRPPWVKEGPNPLPMPTAPWTARGREATATATATDEPNKIEKPGPRKLSKVTIIPSQPSQPAENNAQEIISQATLKWTPKIQEKKQESSLTFSKPQLPTAAEKDKPVLLSKPKPPTLVGKKQETSTHITLQKPSPVIDKKQETSTQITLQQPSPVSEKKQETSTQITLQQPPPVTDKKQPRPPPFSKIQQPQVKEKEVFSQAKLKWVPKPKDKKQEPPSPLLTPNQTLLVMREKKREPSKQPVSVENEPQLLQSIPAKEQPRKNVINKKITPVNTEKDAPSAALFTAKRPSAFIKPKEGPGPSAKSRESTTIPVVVESTKRKDSSTIPVVVESTKRKDSTTIPVTVESSKRKESTEKAPPVPVEPSGPREKRRVSIVQIKKEPEREPPKAAREFAKPIPKPVDKELPKSILKDPSKTSVPSAPKPPPPPPMAPPLPPPPPGKEDSFTRSEMTVQKAAKLEALRSRPRRRPDWTDMMKEVEAGRRLNHVQCNDRSAPILPKEKAKGQFIYESEKDATHDPHKQLLTQIQRGVKLKRVKCNDRSKPILDGLRKFRRQMTIEEQIQKSMSMADVVAVAAEPDELDDIDKVRDDLQSTKQMLALELRNKEALERENKRLMARLLNLEVELEKEKNTKKLEPEKGTGTVGQARSAADEKLVQQLKDEASDATRMSKEMEEKYHNTAEELDATRAKLESAWLRNQQLELELKAGSRGVPPIMKQPSSKKLAASMTSVPNGKAALESDDESEYTEETETETESEEEGTETDAAAIQERRTAREMKLLATKLRSYKEKQAVALKERHSLREQLRKQQKTLRQEKKKYKALQKEVDKMANLMKDDEEAEEDEEERPEDEVEEETETESESEESEEDDPTDGDLPEDAPVEQRRKNLTDRSKHHENRLGTLKKGNYLLKANIDRLQDDINRQREMSLSLQEDLNSVLAELG